MLHAYQIQRMAKPYSDRRLAGLSKKHRGIARAFVGSGFWSNGFAAFHEPIPEKAKFAEVAEAPTDFFTNIAQEVERLNCSVEPVEIRPISRAYNRELIAVKMQNSHCAGWVDGQYISAVLKRHKEHITQVSRRKSGTVIKHPKARLTWKAFDGGVVAIVEGEIVAVVMGLRLEDKDFENPEWTLKNEED